MHISGSITIGARRVGRGQPCFIVAEAGSNHDGKLAQAFELIDTAAECGADAVKFQLFTAAGLYPSNCGLLETPAGAQDFFALLRDLEVPVDWLPHLQERAAQREILLLCTPFDEAAVDSLAEAGATAFKIASPELTHLPLLRHAGHYGRPVLLSTGMSTLGDVEEAVGTLRHAGVTDLALFHCVTAYPTPPRDCNLAVIHLLELAFGTPVGFSDHTLDPVAAPLVTVALGGTLIEKHFTLSRTLSGPDHTYAIEPEELRRMVTGVREIEALPESRRLLAVGDCVGSDAVATLRGKPQKSVVPSEVPLADCDRRALHAIADIAAGEILGAHNVGVLRGERNLGGGLHPRYQDVIEGARAVRGISYGQGVMWEHLVDYPGK